MNAQWTCVEEPAAIEAEILGYYQNLLGSELCQKREASEALEGAIQKKVLATFKDGLVAQVNDIEILTALQSIKKDKAPSPDGFNSTFLLDNWQVLRPDFSHGVKQFFQQGSLPGGWNSTAITLIPKVAAPHSVRAYRPIACCNTTYKCVTKILANIL